MRSNITPLIQSFVYSFALVAVLSVAPAIIHAQDQAPQIVSQPVFKLSDAAVAAGIDGLIGVALTIDKMGKVKDVFFQGEPGWPCKSPTPKQLDAVRDAVKAQLMATTFTPPLKDGKPKEVDVSLQFAVGEAYKVAVREEEAKQRVASGIKLVDAGTVNGRATRLTKPVDRGVYGIVVVRVLIDELGNVVHAGVVSGHPSLRQSVRDAACDSKFSPTILHGMPVKVTGIIMYNLSRR